MADRSYDPPTLDITGWTTIQLVCNQVRQFTPAEQVFTITAMLMQLIEDERQNGDRWGFVEALTTLTEKMLDLHRAIVDGKF